MPESLPKLNGHNNESDKSVGMSKNNPFIQCNELVKVYQTKDIETFALSGLDLTVEKGEVLAIMGPSGSGKSTLLNILGGLDRPTSGEVFVSGVDILSLTPDSLVRYRRDVVGFVWQQNARNLIPYMSAYKNVCLPMMVAGIERKRQDRHARELLRVVGLSDRVSHRSLELSGGEQQRVAIAIALANSPGLLLADEPTGSVDSHTAQQIVGIFKDLASNFGITIIIVSHDPNISRHVDRTIAIFDGRTSFERVRRINYEEVVQQDDYVIVDDAGRIQLPPDVIEHFGIEGRIRLHRTKDHIEIWPTKGKLDHG
jgi:ABC-type lipoprotein export system ATPase subunit